MAISPLRSERVEKIFSPGFPKVGQRGRVIFVLLGVWILAVILPSLHFAPGNWEELRRILAGAGSSPLGSFLLHSLSFFWALGVIILAIALVHSLTNRRWRKKGDENLVYREPPPVPWTVYVFIVLFFLSLVGLVWWAKQQDWRSEKTPPVQSSVEKAEKQSPAVMPRPSPSVSPPVQKPPYLEWVLYLLILGVPVVIGLLLWRLWGRWRERGSSETEEIAQIMARAALDLEKGAQLSDVILRCYRDMCRVLRREVELRQEMTPREFAQRLQQKGVREKEVAYLTGLFERVRYGRYRATSLDRAEAISALRTIEARYGEDSREKRSHQG